MRNKPKLIFLLNCAQRHLHQWIAQQTQMAGAQGGQVPTPAQSGLIFSLARADGASMGQLADVLDLAPSAVSGLVQRMEALDWVIRLSCPDDGRTQRVWLRPAGKDLIPLIRQATTRINERITDGFTEAELGIVARWLGHVRQLDQNERADN